MLNPVWLNTFKTLVDVGHFTKTAEKLYMTQPGVSQHLQKLEANCGHPLIKKQGKSFELTEQGRLVYQYALQQAEHESNLLEKLSFDDPYSGQCQLSCSGSLALKLYPELLKLQQQYPDLHIELEVAPNQKILKDIQSGHTALGIVTDVQSTSLYESEALNNEQLCLVLPSSYKGEPLTPKKLFSCGLIEHPDAKHYLSMYLDLCDDSELEKLNIEELPRAGYINQLNQILLPVSMGLGFTVLPKSAVDNFSNSQDLYVAKTVSPVTETLYLIQKRHRNLPKRYDVIRQLIWKHLGKSN